MKRLIKPTRYFSDELLNDLRLRMDPPADAVLQKLADTEGMPGIREFLRNLTTGSIDIFTNPYTQAFADEVSVLPVWADPEKMKIGRAYLRLHANAISLVLGFLSLPYTYLAADGVQVLALSGRMKSDTKKRLEETGAFVFDLAEEKKWESDFPQMPEALPIILKVRLIHAAVRWMCLHSSRWNESWGNPVNQEDMVGTNLSFSYLVIQGLRKLGIPADPATEEAYLHFWNVVGYWSGVELRPENMREAYVLGNEIARRHFRPSPEGKELTRALLRTIEGEFPANLKNLPAAQMRFLLGDEFADQLGLPSVFLEKKLIPILPIRLFLGTQ